ncbi:MAG: heavy-metal-associated domain-containing protein [Chitinophagaceae bacterium]|nr:heavy-metal-associated domain-containing protein [Chitinophagaceae bacterium]
MKNIIKLIIALLIVVPSQAQIKKVTLEASGLTCAMCSKAVYNALLKVPFVAGVKPNIQESIYEITLKPGAGFDPDALSKVVSDAGFSVSGLKAVVQFNGIKIANDEHVFNNGLYMHFVNVTPQQLQGEKLITFIDKNVVSAKNFKKYAKLTTMKCYETGAMSACCTKPAAVNNARVIHVTI